MNAAIKVVSDALARLEARPSRMRDDRFCGDVGRCLIYAGVPRGRGPEPTRSVMVGRSKSRLSRMLRTDTHGTPALPAASATASSPARLALVCSSNATPSCATARTVAAPMPLAAPVIRMTRSIAGTAPNPRGRSRIRRFCRPGSRSRGPARRAVAACRPETTTECR